MLRSSCSRPTFITHAASISRSWRQRVLAVLGAPEIRLLRSARRRHAPPGGADGIRARQYPATRVETGTNHRSRSRRTAADSTARQRHPSANLSPPCDRQPGHADQGSRRNAGTGSLRFSSYDGYVQAEWQLFAANPERAASAREAVSGMPIERVLDVGCGAGQSCGLFCTAPARSASASIDRRKSR